jgi:hypothetical protein
MKKTLLLVVSLVLAALLLGCQDPTQIEGEVTANATSGPDNLAVKAQGPGYVLLTWDSREGVNKYYIYRKEAGANTGAVYLGSTSNDSSYYIDRASITNGLENGKKYEYFVSVSNGGPASSTSVTTANLSVPAPGSEVSFPPAMSITVQPYSTQTGDNLKNNALIVSLPADPLYQYTIKVERRATGAANWKTGVATLGSSNVSYNFAEIDRAYTGIIKTNINLGGYVLGEAAYEYRVAVYYDDVNSYMDYKVPVKAASDINAADFVAEKSL